MRILLDYFPVIPEPKYRNAEEKKTQLTSEMPNQTKYLGTVLI